MAKLKVRSYASENPVAGRAGIGLCLPVLLVSLCYVVLKSNVSLTKSTDTRTGGGVYLRRSD